MVWELAEEVGVWGGCEEGMRERGAAAARERPVPVELVPYQIPQSRPSFPPGSAWRWLGRNPRQRTTPCEPHPCPVGSPCPGERVEPCSCSSLPPLLSWLSLQLVGKRYIGYIM
ncbi:hypothetical protein GBAR_LOCUS17924 [Geodia barretti]|uniref:Uncharacterized protein n=1 Tax=Geodia barretti TaxID=519541 RepID=A0AA35WYP4_GEOBA|nr:hypothetical protein GBAR_LOCUS17924 [Geodia barretti]